MKQAGLRLSVLLLVMALLAACAGRAVPGVPAAALPSAGAPDAADPAATAAPEPTAGQSAPGQTAPATAGAPLSLDELRVTPELTVRTVRTAQIYAGRGRFTLQVADVGVGTELEYLDSREGWIHVRTAGGEVGWIASGDTWLLDARRQPVSYSVMSGRWRLAAEAGPVIELARLAAGVLRLSVSGPFGRPVVRELTDRSIWLDGIAPPPVRAALDIGDSGLARLSLSAGGLLVELESGSVLQVLRADEGRLELEFRPGLERVELTPDALVMQIRGDLRPVLRHEGTELVVDLPGGRLAANFTNPPEGVAMAIVEPEPGGSVSTPGSLTATIPTRMAGGGLRIRLPAPETPYALYRAAPDRLELRFLPPGLQGKTIVLDPGHGGEETGAAGVTTGLREKDVNLAVALLLKPMLEEAGARVLITRTADTRVLPSEIARVLKTLSERTQADLAARSAMANEAVADLFLSIHANGGPPGDGGIETFWSLSNLNATRSLRLAALAQAELVGTFGFYDRGVKQRGFNVIRFSQAPAALVELGFMTSPAEERVLTSAAGQRAAAAALFRAVRAYFER